MDVFEPRELEASEVIDRGGLTDAREGQTDTDFYLPEKVPNRRANSSM